MARPEVDVLHDGHVRIVDPGAVEGVAVNVAKRTDWLVLHHSIRIEPVVLARGTEQHLRLSRIHRDDGADLHWNFRAGIELHISSITEQRVRTRLPNVE